MIFGIIHTVICFIHRRTTLSLKYFINNFSSFLIIFTVDEDMVVEKKNILEKIRLRGTVFVNLRPDTKIEVNQCNYIIVTFNKLESKRFIKYVM